MTPLHIASDKGNKELVVFLITNGFDFNIKNGAG
jgi:ankyrin repeat protein